jgi:hypothetical protein
VLELLGRFSVEDGIFSLSYSFRGSGFCVVVWKSERIGGGPFGVS